MDLSINASSTAASGQTAAWQQKKQDYNSLISAAQSGDVASAQDAFASLTANKAPPANSPLAALGTALQSGDAATIKTATQALQSARGGHGHHHHHAQPAATPETPAATDSTASAATVNILA